MVTLLDPNTPEIIAAIIDGYTAATNTTSSVRLYPSWRCWDDLDSFGDDPPALDDFLQDVYHLLITVKGDLWYAPDFGFGLPLYLGKPLPSTLAADIENKVREDDRCSNAKCTISQAGDAFHYTLNLVVEVESGFLQLALDITPAGITSAKIT